MTTNHWHSPQLISQNRLSAILEIMRSGLRGLKVREFRAHGQEEKIYRVCCETSCQ